MKHISLRSSYLSLWLLLLAAPVAAIGQEQPQADIPRGTVEVDGIIDAQWEAIPEQALSVDIDETAPTAPDFAGYWKGLWDETHLYLLLVTVDDTTVPYPLSEFWNYDMTEVFIDPDNSKGSSYDGVNDSQFVWPRGGEGAFGHANPLNVTLPLAREGLVQNEGTVVLEVAFPMEELGITPLVGTQIGLDIYMKDNDSGFSQRDNQISWSPSNDRAWRNPSLLGTVTLVDVSVDPLRWNGYAVDSNGWANTESWLGWVNTTFDPWIIVVNRDGRFVYIPDDSGWVFIPK